MKKYFFIFGGFFLLFFFSIIVGSSLVSANKAVDEVSDIIASQNKMNKYFSSYGYTVDNPKIILNPYKISPLTALILFETPDDANISIRIVGKDEGSTFSNTFSKNKKHFIPIYGLYPNSDNKVILSYNDKIYEYHIKTEELPEDFVLEDINNDGDLKFINSDNYPYAIDKNNDVRWFLNKKFVGKLIRLGNGHFILGDDNFLDLNISKDIFEIDLFGKIYYQYSIPSGYYGSFSEDNERLLVLSNKVIQIDRQNGHIFNDVKSDINDKNIDEKFVYPLYSSQDEYKILKGVSFSSNIKTNESKKRVFLINYKKIDKKYSDYNIKFLKSNSDLIITGDINEADDVVVILDKFLEKNVYDMDNKYLVINHEGLNGKYSIYVKINDVIYKTDYYVSF